MLESTILKDLLETKWARLEKLFYMWSLEYLAFLICFTTSIALRPVEWSSTYLPSVTVGILELIVLVHMIVSTFLEFRDMVYLKMHYFSCFKLFTLLVWMSNITFFCAFAFRFAALRVNLFFFLSLLFFSFFFFLFFLLFLRPSFFSEIG
jgi:hypothetical protein